MLGALPRDLATGNFETLISLPAIFRCESSYPRLHPANPGTGGLHRRILQPSTSGRESSGRRYESSTRLPSEARRARAAASDVAAELPPPPSLASECFEHEPQVLDEPRGREAERGGHCMKKRLMLLTETVPSHALTHIRCRFLLNPPAPRRGRVWRRRRGMRATRCRRLLGRLRAQPLLDECRDAAE